MNNESVLHPRTVKSFVLRTGRMTVAQKQALEAFWPQLGLELNDGMLDEQQVFGRKAPLVLEIGFGMGDSLIKMAGTFPDKDYLGVEVHTPGVGNILKPAHEAHMENLRIYRADAKDVLQHCIPKQSLSAIQIYFPDPWHKTRHHKRRLIQSDFVTELGQFLKVGGCLHLATDWEPYALHMMEVLSALPEFRNVFGDGQWALKHDRPQTKFEKRGQKLGHGVWDLVFTRV